MSAFVNAANAANTANTAADTTPDITTDVAIVGAGPVGLMIANQIALLQYPAACANAVVLLLVVLLMIAAILRIVDIRREL